MKINNKTDLKQLLVLAQLEMTHQKLSPPFLSLTTNQDQPLERLTASHNLRDRWKYPHLLTGLYIK